MNSVIFPSARELGREIQLGCPPGHVIELDRHILRDVNPSPGWSEPEWILENIIGSAFEYSFSFNHLRGTVVFHRRKEPLLDGRRTYVSPDRKHLFDPLPDGTYRPKASEPEGSRNLSENGPRSDSASR